MRHITIAIIMMICAGSLAIPARVVLAESQSDTTEETFTPEIPIPGTFAGPQVADDTLLSKYVRAIFIYFIWTIGIVATVMVMYGGIRWVSAAGNPGQIKEARDIIDNAIIGVIIGLTSVVLLNIINPRLSELSIPKLASVEKENFADAHISKVCPVKYDVECNGLYRIGDVEVDKKITTDYCIGTKKPSNLKTPDWYCQLSKKASNPSLFLSGIELPSIPIYKEDPTQPTDPSINGLDILPVLTGEKCGEVKKKFAAPKIRVGLDDPHGKENPEFCYLNGIYGKYDPATNKITNMCWPGDPCPN